jgi:hypothetical protein
MSITIESALTASAFMFVVAGCGFLKKDSVADAAAGTGGLKDAGSPPQDTETVPSGKEAKGSTTFSVKRHGDVPPGYGIEPGAYTMALSHASIVTGTVLGLEIAFESAYEKEQKRSLSMMLVSNKILSFWTTYDGGRKLHFKYPETPFTLTEGDYPAGPNDERGHPLTIGPVVTHEFKVPGGAFSAWFVHFRKFKLEITDAAIVDEHLTLSGTLSGESVPGQYDPPAVYEISGSFTIKGAELGLKNRD